MRECEVKSANRVLGPQDRVSPQQTASSLSPSRARQRGDAELELKSKLFFEREGLEALEERQVQSLVDGVDYWKQ